MTLERWRPRGTTVAGLLVATFALRLLFGLCSELFGPDESQIFLIGLKYFTTGAWPYFGPDVVYTHTQIPGALQGLLVGGPMFLVAQPEAAYAVVNLLSMASLVLLAWYIGRREPDLPRWFLWPWVFFAPWTLDYSTHIINTSYVIDGGVLFFVGACEATPRLRAGAIPQPLAFAMMGFGLIWVAQLHLSATLLIVMAGIVFVLAARASLASAGRHVAMIAAGALVASVTLLPTFVHAGLQDSLRAYSSETAFHGRNVLEWPQVVARFLSFASFEIARFIGASTDTRLDFLRQFPWAAPFVVVAGLIGVVQVGSLIAGAFLRRHGRPSWAPIRWATIAVVCLICAAFTMSAKDPASHTFYVTLPIAMMYACACWAPLFRRPLVRRMAATLLICGAVTHVALAWRNLHLRSLYTDRALVMRAIAERDYRIVGERR
jgi:hypothetical protein